MKPTMGIVLEANLDGLNTQFHGYLREQFLKNGAKDVSFLPLLRGKKGLGVMLRVIAPEMEADRLSDRILREAETWEVYIYRVEHKGTAASWKEMETPYGKVRVKESGGTKFHPEYEDCRSLALEKKIPIQEVHREALRNIE